MDIKKLFEIAGVELTDDQLKSLLDDESVAESDLDDEYKEVDDEEIMFMAKSAYGHVDQAMHALDGVTLLLDPNDSRVEDYKYVEAKIKHLMVVMRSVFDIE